MSFGYVVVFLYSGRRDYMMRLNSESKDSFGMITCEWKFFYNFPILYANLNGLTVTFQAINKKRVHFSTKRFQRDQNKIPHFFLHVSIMTGKLSQIQLSATCY